MALLLAYSKKFIGCKMLDKKIKSDRIRFKYIDRFLVGREVLDIGSSEGNLHALLTKSNNNKQFFTMGLGKNADFKINIDKQNKLLGSII